MNPMILLAGGLIGLGVFVVVRELFPAPPALAAALDRFDTRPRRGPVPDPGSGLFWRIGHWLNTRITGSALDVRIPRKDLALLGKSVESYLAQKLALALFGLAAPTIVWAWLMPTVPWPLPVGFILTYAVFMFIAPDIAVRSQARDAREEFRTALIAYLDLVKMARTGGAGPAEALETPARICRGWPFERLSAALDPTARGTRDTWDELSRLAEQIDVGELADTATIARRAGLQGARILDSLTAKAGSLREQQLARTLAQAKSRTETMTVPVALSVLGYLVLLGYPAYARIVGG